MYIINKWLYHFCDTAILLLVINLIQTFFEHCKVASVNDTVCVEVKR